MKIIVQLSVGWPAFLVSLALSSIYAKERSLALNSQKSSQNKTEHSFPKGIDQDPCLKVPLRPQLWSSLKMNTYLDEYPWGSELNLEDYARHVGATNFFVGVGEHPHPGQLCESVKGRDWYALVAAQNWNSFVNSLYDSVGYAFGVMSGVVPQMLIDFEKDPTMFYKHTASYIGLMTTWVSSFPGCMFSTWGPITSGMFSSLGDIAWNSLVGVMYVSTSLAYINAVLLVGGGEDRFTRASGVAKMLAEAQKGIQSTICNITRSIVNSPINQRTGLAGINPDGIFLNEVPSNFQNNLQREFELAMKLKTLAKFWRVQNAFIVRGSDPCVQSGPNGAFSREDMLSYCGDDNIMMNIVRAEKHGNGFDPTIYNAQLLETKYGYSAEFLTTSAWKCQSKYGVFEYDACILSNRTSTQFTLSELSKAGDCYFSIPVCDLTKPELQALRNKKSFSITKICREVGGLPI